ncbi:hypothetical protein [Bradyrhizobium sp.]|jgi:hypothetical protein|nr:hypothetical protein [Bradyrhizobium sp.]
MVPLTGAAAAGSRLAICTALQALLAGVTLAVKPDGKGRETGQVRER